MKKDSKNIEEKSASARKKGCIFWIIVFLLTSLLIISYFVYIILRPKPITPKEVFYEQYFDGFMQIKIDEQLANRLLSELLSPQNLKKTGIKQSDIDIDQVKFYFSKMFYHDVYVFFRKAKEYPNNEKFLLILSIKRLPNLLKKTVYQAFDGGKLDIASLKKEDNLIYRLENDTDVFYFAIAETSILISNDKRAVADAINARKANMPAVDKADPDFSYYVAGIDDKAVISGFFINKNNRMNDFFSENYPDTNIASDVLKDAVDVKTLQALYINKVQALLLNFKYDTAQSIVKMIFTCRFSDQKTTNGFRDGFHYLIDEKIRNEVLKNLAVNIDEKNNGVILETEFGYDQIIYAVKKGMEESKTAK